MNDFARPADPGGSGGTACPPLTEEPRSSVIPPLRCRPASPSSGFLVSRKNLSREQGIPVLDRVLPRHAFRRGRVHVYRPSVHEFSGLERSFGLLLEKEIEQGQSVRCLRARGLAL